MTKFLVMEGVHYEKDPNIKLDPNATRRPHFAVATEDAPGNLTRYERGDIVETKVNLTKKFPNKFQKLTETEAIAVVAARRQEGEPPVVSDLGTDVTHEFQMAYDHQLLVFKDGQGLHTVCRRDGPAKAVVAMKAQLRADQVEKFVAQYLKSVEK